MFLRLYLIVVLYKLLLPIFCNVTYVYLSSNIPLLEIREPIPSPSERAEITIPSSNRFLGGVFRFRTSRLNIFALALGDHILRILTTVKSEGAL
ncbi:hypothetical protein F5Y02DRAFT_204226 [Annulohypoxylon stygium]|nr:hypothetical protein F5Y02DRAFT_204226 [Annulohypoxylon stygium]